MTFHVHPGTPALRDAVLAALGTKTYAAIAADLGISKNSVCGIVNRAGAAKARKARKPRRLGRSFVALHLNNLREGLSRRQSLYITHPDIRP